MTRPTREQIARSVATSSAIASGRDWRELERMMLDDRRKEMIEKKWTPGPWEAMRNNAFWEINPVGDAGPFTIGDVCDSAPGFPDGGLQEANAHLISAAPDLVEALEDVVYQMRNAPPEVLADYFDMDRAHKALAKAYGEEQ